MTEAEIARVEAVSRGGVGVHAGIPFPALHEHCRVRDQCVGAEMVEVKMRVGDERLCRGITVDRRWPRTDLIAGLNADPEQSGEPRAESPGGVMLDNPDAARCRIVPCP